MLVDRVPPDLLGPKNRAAFPPQMLSRAEIKTRLITAAIRLGTDPNRLSASHADLADAAGLPVDVVRRHVIGSDPLALLARDLLIMGLQRMSAALLPIEDPAEQLATAIRLYVRRAHDNPARAEFILRYGAGSTKVCRLLAGPIERCIRRGLLVSRFHIRESQIAMSTTMVCGVTAGAANLVARELHDWEKAGSYASRCVLTGLGVYQSEAIRLARLRLPVVPPILLGDGAGATAGPRSAG